MVILFGQSLIIIGLVFIAFGLISILRFRNFFSRVLISSKVDTVGMICIMIGVSIMNGLSFFTMKVLLVLLTFIFVGPLMTHYIARGGYYSGIQLNKEQKHD